MAGIEATSSPYFALLPTDVRFASESGLIEPSGLNKTRSTM